MKEVLNTTVDLAGGSGTPAEVPFGTDLAKALNQDCHCLTLDRDALARALELGPDESLSVGPAPPR